MTEIISSSIRIKRIVSSLHSWSRSHAPYSLCIAMHLNIPKTIGTGIVDFAALILPIIRSNHTRKPASVNA